MADQGIKKVTVLKNSLPALNSNSNEYIVRYRIVSEDKNRTSHWSPKYRLVAPTVDEIVHSISYNPDLQTITIVWSPTAGSQSEFDIYSNFDNSGWQYITTVSSTIYATVVPTGTVSAKFAVQTPTYPKERSAGATFFETAQINL